PGGGASGADPADEQEVHPVADPHPEGPADRPQDDAVRGQTGESDEGTITDGVHADDEGADEPPGEGAPEPELLRESVVGRALVAERPEERPPEQPTEGPEDGVKIDADQQCHEGSPPSPEMDHRLRRPGT